MSESSSSANQGMKGKTEYPAILRGNDILVPLKVDLTYAGARYVDTFCWNLNCEMTPYEFAARTCSDLNLPFGFQAKAALLISEQVEAFKVIVSVLRSAFDNNLEGYSKIKEPQLIGIGIRHSTVDYNDKFMWDPMSAAITPEMFASSTCSDLGLPGEMEPAIAHKLREILFRNLMSWVDDSKSLDTIFASQTTHPIKTSEIGVKLVPAATVVEMTSQLWKRVKPSPEDVFTSIPQPMLPYNRDTNAMIWCKSD